MVEPRLVAIALTLALSLFIVAALTFVMIGPDLAQRVAAWFGLADVFALLWSIVRWPLLGAFVVLGVDLVYHFAPNRRVRWAWVTPGALVATVDVGAQFLRVQALRGQCRQLQRDVWRHWRCGRASSLVLRLRPGHSGRARVAGRQS